MNVLKFRRKIAKQGERRLITIPPALWEMLDFEREYIVMLKPVEGGER